MADQQQGKQIPMDDVFEIYGNDCMMLKLNIKELIRVNAQQAAQIAELQKQIEEK